MRRELRPAPYQMFALDLLCKAAHAAGGVLHIPASSLDNFDPHGAFGLRRAPDGGWLISWVSAARQLAAEQDHQTANRAAFERNEG